MKRFPSLLLSALLLLAKVGHAAAPSVDSNGRFPATVAFTDVSGNTVVVSAANPLPTTGSGGGGGAGGTVTQGPAGAAAWLMVDSLTESRLATLVSLLNGGLPAALGQTTMSGSLPVVLPSNQSAIPVNNYSGVTVVVSGSANLTASSDNSYTFSATAHHLLIQNNSTAVINIAFDATASAGSFVVGASGAISLDVPCAVLHIYSASATAVNGSVGSNIVVLGWS